jgi:MYXO-CTERM domain-containing protein
MHRRVLSSLKLLVPLALTTLAPLPATGQTKTFTVDADFDSGTLTNTLHNPSNQIVLGRTPVSQTTIVWATNYRYGWVVRIDSNTGKQTGRFDAALVSINGQATGAQASKTYCDFANVGNCPGRVAVDTRGDVWIVNRAFGKQGTLSKFSGDLQHCIDRNNNGVIDTSKDVNNDGIINPDDPAEFFGQNDECILTTIPVGPTNMWPRGVAVDRRGKIWVATHQDGKIYRYNPDEPVALEATVTVGGNPYSLATGGKYVFVSSSSGGTRRVDIDTLAVQTVSCPGTYGVVASVDGSEAYLGSYFAMTGGWYKANFNNNSCTFYGGPGGITTAMTLDLQNNVWTADYNTATVSKFTTTGTLLGRYPAGGGNPHGLSVDFLGNIWTITHSAPHRMTKINSGTGAIITQPSISGPGAYDYDPYIYSDFTGVQVDRISPYTRVGSWDGVYDGGVPNIPWSKVTWNAEPQGAVPVETTLQVLVRAANTLAELGSAPYAPTTNGQMLVGVKGRYVQVRTELKGPGFLTPVMSDVSVTGPCNPLSESCCVKDSDCNDGIACTADLCPTPGGACVHPQIPNCCTTNAECDDGNQCSFDVCPGPGLFCTHTGLPGCCNSNADCADNDLCTVDICSGPGGMCSHPLINGCCNSDLDCTQGNLCSAAVCSGPGGTCSGGAIPGCCQSDADCADANLCTIDVCNTMTSTCTNTLQPACCNVDGQCDDGNPCTTDTCSGPGGVCVHAGIPGCCTPNDPQVGMPCDAPIAPNDQPPCKAGAWVCNNGTFQCVGAVKPSLDICDGLDNNCDGIADSPSPCPMGTKCTLGVCAPPCKTGEFPCPSGQQCIDDSCVPLDCNQITCPQGQVCFDGSCIVSDGGIPTGSSSSGAGGSSSTSGSSSSSGAGGGETSSSSSSGSPGSWGLATGGGGCKCSLVAEKDNEAPMGALATLALGLAVTARRRRGSR